MNKSWSGKNKQMQTLISKEATFDEGIKVLLELRAELFEQITSIVKTFPPLDNARRSNESYKRQTVPVENRTISV